MMNRPGMNPGMNQMNQNQMNYQVSSFKSIKSYIFVTNRSISKTYVFQNQRFQNGMMQRNNGMMPQMMPNQQMMNNPQL